MRKNNTGGKSGNNSTCTTHLFRLTKEELIRFVSGEIKKPLSPEDLYLCAASVLHGWCDDVIADRYASMYDLTRKLETLEKSHTLFGVSKEMPIFVVQNVRKIVCQSENIHIKIADKARLSPGVSFGNNRYGRSAKHGNSLAYSFYLL